MPRLYAHGAIAAGIGLNVGIGIGKIPDAPTTTMPATMSAATVSAATVTAATVTTTMTATTVSATTVSTALCRSISRDCYRYGGDGYARDHNLAQHVLSPSMTCALN